MASININDKLKLPVVKNKPINRKVLPNLAVSKIAKKLESRKPSVTKNPVNPVPSTNNNAEKAGKRISTQTKLKPEKSSLPCLDYEHVLKILRLAETENLEFKQLILVRSLGKAWKLAIDNFYLPFRYKPASLWSPYMSDKVPEDALAISPGKHFKFPRDIQLFQEMSTHPHNPFPTRELKIWCQAKLPILENLRTSFDLVAVHIWSLTYVVGATVDSIRLLYNLLGKMSHLKDLRVIEAHPDAMDKHLRKNKETVLLPQLELPSSPPPQLSCLSVTGSNNPSILLDTLLKAFRGSELKSLEMQGKAAATSEFLQRKKRCIDFFLNVQKLKICGADDESLEAILNGWDWGDCLTHLSIYLHPRENSPILSNRLARFFGWNTQITDLYLYFDNLSETDWSTYGAYGGPPKILLHSLHSVRKLGLPYFFALWNWKLWPLCGCENVMDVEFHDWAATVNKRRRDSNSVKFKWVEKTKIRSIVSRYSGFYLLKTVTVYFGKSAKHSVVFQMEESFQTRNKLLEDEESDDD